MTTPPNRLDYIQFRGWTAAEWAASDPIPGYREPCWSTDTHELRVGDGVTHWSALPVAFAETYAALSQTANQGNLLTTGEENIPRSDATNGSTSLLSQGWVLGSYFTARKTETINNLSVITLVAAAATPTLCRMGVYGPIDASGNGPLIAACANDTSLWSVGATRYTRATLAPFAKVAGQRYMTALIIVTAGTRPTFVGNGPLGALGDGSAPPLCSLMTGQTDLPANFVKSGNPGVMHYMEMLP